MMRTPLSRHLSQAYRNSIRSWSRIPSLFKPTISTAPLPSSKTISPHQIRSFSLRRPLGFQTNGSIRTAPFLLRRFEAARPKLSPQGWRRSFLTSRPVFFAGNVQSASNGSSLSIGQRLKHLSKEYGSSAIAVYFLLSVLDFPFCFLAVRLIGKEKIAEHEHAVIDWFWRIMPQSVHEWKLERAQKQAAGGGVVEEEGAVDGDGNGNGNGGKKEASIWTELALAYAVHKSLIFFRVPLTAAVTPKIVNALRARGFRIGKPRGIRDGVQLGKDQIQRRREIKAALKKQQQHN